MAGASRTDERQVAPRFCLVALGWGVCLFSWASLLSFDIADPPSTSVWPNNSPPNNLLGVVGAWVAYHLLVYLGVGAFPLVGLVHAAVLAASRGSRLNDLGLRVLGLILFCTATSACATLWLGAWERLPLTGPGGVLGTATAAFLLSQVDALGTALLLMLAGIVGLVLAADDLLLLVFRWLRWAGNRSTPVIVQGGTVVARAGVAVASGVGTTVAGRRPLQGGGVDAPGPGESGSAGRVERSLPRVVRPEPPGSEDTEEEPGADDPRVGRATGAAGTVGASAAGKGDAVVAPLVSIPVTRGTGPAPTPRAGPAPATARDSDDHYVLPRINLLERPIPLDKGTIERSCREKAYILEQTLNEFRLAVEVVAIETGPVITVFELKLAPGIKVSQVASLSNDMARALKAPAVRVVAPLPGKSTIGIEVPNIDKEKVRLRDVMELAGARSEHLAVPLFLGKDASGQPLVADLTRMPHLLIAGTTGSGKSVCITSLIMSILMTRTPSEVNLILVDPKVVELSIYKDVPHLICPIVTEVAKAEAILDWASTKMDERYALLAEAGVKDIRSYNRLGYAGLRERMQITTEDEMAAIPLRLPYIVLIIDELADLMMTSAKEVEFYLCRIAQKSRAVGIHLIVSTQRPQANVVTGLIKSNLPSRIAFRVSSRLDSRIVLDQNGGEVLMGQGDMLFLPPGSSKLVRAQGTFVDEDELKAVVKHCKEQCAPQFHPELVRMPGPTDAAATERDELFDQAVEIILEAGRGSVSLLQRRLTIGYGRASRLVDQMYEAGIVGEYKGSQAREVLISLEQWQALRRQRDREEAAEREPHGS